ncbi:MAG: (deoxy)nucleoside triphosphate pyrophosphohydrolase [Owenweeksia sp.]
MIKVVCGVIVEDKRVLLAQRSENMEHPHKWEFPGGKIKEGETAEAALKRELREELRMDIHVTLAIQPVLWKYPDKTVHLQPVICQWVGGEPRAIEHHQLKWCLWAELKELDILDADIAIVNQIERFL